MASINEAKSVIIFQTDLFDLSWPKDDGDPNDPPLGKDAADYFRRRMTDFGVVVLGMDAVSGEQAWHWDVRINDALFNVSVQWWPIGAPPRDVWVVQIHRDRGLVAALIGKRNCADDIEPMVKVFQRIIEQDAKFNDAHWLTMSEFRGLG
jgi:hypothetical protein